MTKESIRAALAARNIGLGPPASKDDLARLGAGLGCLIDDRARSLYLNFNGFQNSDHRSQIRLWNIDTILNELALSNQLKGAPYFAFGDYLIQSDILMCCFENTELPVYNLYEQKQLAPSLEAFVDSIIEGHFDFI